MQTGKMLLSYCFAFLQNTVFVKDSVAYATNMKHIKMALCGSVRLKSRQMPFQMHTCKHMQTRPYTHTTPVIVLSGFQWLGLIGKARGRVLSAHHTATFIDSIYTHTNRRTHSHTQTDTHFHLKNRGP